MSLLKFIFALIVGVLLFCQGMGAQVCVGSCKQYPDCDFTCKKQHYAIGFCVPNPSLPPGNDRCCCGK
ncbi:hypothetical protein Lalb_Chr17g0344791 [Lupinus albus]|uniref:LCR n=1 Tax=Lupinus albus TaxID=3870 RepID=A0A6A4P353_LUPAL|nr:hypothetical protein Lalb_Chr17g0344791 [Lupinus albus]